MRLYTFLGQALHARSVATGYAEWVETYASPAFETLAHTLETVLNRYGLNRYGPARYSTDVARGNDVAIVGAGSAGCVLAARLSEDASRRVLLLEAGPDYAADQLPPQVANGWEVAYALDWGFTTESDASGRSINAWRSRLVGGCSAVNAAIALRGHPRDYDGWAELGNSGWSFDDILPYFRRLESDADFRTPHHGGDRCRCGATDQMS